MKKTRIGVLGCANIARRSMIPAVKLLDSEFELVGVASREIIKAIEFSKEFNCFAYKNYMDLLADPTIEAVYIPLPTGLHNEWVNKALYFGKHVYAEKALAFSYGESLEMVENAKKYKLTLMEGYMFQYHSQHDIVRKIISSKTIGQIRFFHSTFCFPPLDCNNFRYNNELGGGVLYDAAGYPLRALHNLLGDTFEVKSATLNYDQKYKTATIGSAYLVSEAGIGATIAFGFDNFYQCRYEIIAQNGKIVAERAFTPRENMAPQIIFESEGNGVQLISAEPDNHFVKALLVFHNAISNNDKRKELYDTILLQSQSIDRIKQFAIS